ncbi:MAG: hypothetical protein LR015_05645 [Verrucomicrobia bacterium]|nr:hypothetical protein [Verrucomicrobiota bacterium]
MLTIGLAACVFFDLRRQRFIGSLEGNRSITNDEFGYAVAWDDDYTVTGALYELNNRGVAYSHQFLINRPWSVPFLPNAVYDYVHHWLRVNGYPIYFMEYPDALWNPDAGWFVPHGENPESFYLWHAQTQHWIWSRWDIFPTVFNLSVNAWQTHAEF